MLGSIISGEFATSSTKRTKLVQPMANDEIDIFASSEELEAKCNRTQPEHYQKGKTCNIDETLSPKFYDVDKILQDRSDKSILGQSSTSVEELEFSCDGASQNQSKSVDTINDLPDKTSASETDCSCIILDDSNAKDNTSTIVLGDSESQEEDAEYARQQYVIKQEVIFSKSPATMQQQKNKSLYNVSDNSAALFTNASKVPMKEIQNTNDSSSNDYPIHKSGTNSPTQHEVVRRNSLKQSHILTPNTNYSEKEKRLCNDENKDNDKPNNTKLLANVVSCSESRMRSVLHDSESNTLSTIGSENSAISADDEATHSAQKGEEPRVHSSLSCSSSRPGSSLMYANSPSQTSAWGSDISPITRLNSVAGSKQDTNGEERLSELSSSEILSNKNIGISSKYIMPQKAPVSFMRSSERRFSTPGRPKAKDGHIAKENKISYKQAVDCQKEINTSIQETLQGKVRQQSADLSTDNELQDGEKYNKTSPISGIKVLDRNQENYEIENTMSLLDTMDTNESTKKDSLKSISQQHIFDSDNFKTPSATPPSTYNIFTQDSQFHIFKISDLELLKSKWPDAYNFLVPKRQIFKRHDNVLQATNIKNDRRMSDVSSLSSNSRSSGSAGYLADIGTSSSSGASTVSSFNIRSKRDRLSIDPESAIGKGTLIAPLPDPKQRVARLIEERDSMCSTTRMAGSKVGSDFDNDLNMYPLASKYNQFEKHCPSKLQTVEELIPIKPRGKYRKSKSSRNLQMKALNEKKSSEEFDPQSQEIPIQKQLKIDGLGVKGRETASMPLMKKGMKVFAKWTQNTDIRYYPGVIVNDDDDENNVEDEGDKKFSVKFDDGFERGGLRWNDMIPVGMLEMGNAVNIDDSDTEAGIYHPATLAAYPEFVREGEHEDELGTTIEVMYTVDYEKTKGRCSIPQFDTGRVSYKRVFLDKNQAASIKKNLGGYWNPPSSCPSVAEMTLDNLVSGKRRSRPQSTPNKNCSSTNTPQKRKLVQTEAQKCGHVFGTKLDDSIKITPNKQRKKVVSTEKESYRLRSSIGSERKSKRGGDLVETSVAEDDEDALSEKYQLNFSRKLPHTASKQVNYLSTTEEEYTETIHVKQDRRKRKSSKLTSEIQPMKQNVSTSPNQLFDGIYFVLTQGSKPLLANKRDAGDTDITSAMETETESEMIDTIFKESSSSKSLGFDRRHLKEVIVKYGGTVLEEFPGGTHSPFPQPNLDTNGQYRPSLIVVSDRYCQTMSFLLAIGFGVPRISHLWVLQSVTERRLQPMKNYYLPVGWSISEEREIEQSEHNSLEKLKGGIFEGIHILLSSSNNSFINDWKPLLARLGASISCRMKGKFDRSLKAVDVVVGDGSKTPTTIFQSANEKKIPVVTSVWIIQSLITGNRTPYDAFLLIMA